MKIYIDESGNTGSVVNSKKGKLNFSNQPLFAIGTVIVKDEGEEKELTEKYKQFKVKFGFESEIKGSDLLKRENNEALEWFVENVLDEEHFYVNLYNKKYYLSTLLIRAIMGNAFAEQETLLYHIMAACLSLQNDDFFEEYCKFIEKPTEEGLEKYLRYLCEYKYIYDSNNATDFLTGMAKLMIEKGEFKNWVDDFMTFGWYEDSSVTNVINLNALSEFLIMFKLQYNISNSELEVIHDHIQQFEETFLSELGAYGLKLNFEDSKKEILLQIADNIASIFSHSVKNMVKHFSAREQWEEKSEWDLQLLSRVLKKIGTDNIKFTIPMHDWATALCVAEMFSPVYPKEQRKNLFFNPMYIEAQQRIIESIIYYSQWAEKGEEFLGK